MRIKNNLILLVILTMMVPYFSFIPTAAAVSTNLTSNTPAATGDMDSSGSLTDEFNSGTSVPSGSVSFPVLILGKNNQKVNDVIINEGSAGAINSNKAWIDTTNLQNIIQQTSNETAYIKVTAPYGVTFSSVPTVTVSSGDLQLNTDSVAIQDDDNTLTIPVRSQSTVASTITISNIMLGLNRMVQDGPVVLKIGGDALNQTLDVNGQNGIFPASKELEVTVGICKGETSEPQNVTAAFVMGVKSYTLNGNQMPMDVAPYVKDNQIFVPIRNLAPCLGIDSQNIFWNSNDQTVTIMKKSKTAQVAIGSDRMLINGISVDLGAEPEIVDNHVMIPLNSIAQFFDSTVTWDELKKTAFVRL